jgi:hypothetical protein
MLPKPNHPIDLIDNDPPSHPPLNGKAGGKHHWSFAEVQEDMVETLLMWRRAPGGGRFPFATDGPWHLIRKEWEDYDARDPAPLRRLPLTIADVKRMERVSEWLQLAPEGDRQLIVIVLGQLAGGAKRVSWAKVRARLDAEISPRGLGQRYSRAIAAIARALTKGREPRPWAGEDAAEAGAEEALLRPSRR